MRAADFPMFLHESSEVAVGTAAALRRDMNTPRNLRVLPLITLSLALGASLLTGCAKDDDEETATATVTSALQASPNDGLTHDIVEAPEVASAVIDPMKVAAKVASGDRAIVQPAGCATRTLGADKKSVHFVFKACTGPFGKVKLDGSADVSFALDEQNHLVADITSGADLHANDRPLQYKAHGVVAVSGSVRDVTWHADASGETKRGRSYTRSTDLAFKLDLARAQADGSTKRCIDGGGVAKGKVAGVEIAITVDGLSVCESACPKGHVQGTVKGPLGKERSAEITFDGSDQAHVKLPKRELDITLACDESESAE